MSSLFCLIIAIGVASFYSIRLANRAAITGFGLFDRSIGIQADLILTSPSGRMRPDQLQLAQDLVRDLPVVFVPVAETTASEDLPDQDRLVTEQYTLLGLDTLALANLSYHDPDALANRARASFGDTSLADPLAPSADGGVLISEALARKKQLQRGDSLSLIIDDQVRSLRIMHVAPDQVFRVSQPASILFTDLVSLQKMLGTGQSFDRIELFVPPGPLKQGWVQQAQTMLQQPSKGWLVDTAQSAFESRATMTQAFRLNLTILSALALLVGLYLILQGLDAAVTRRQMEVATLKSLGVSARVVQSAWLLESLFLGMIGSFIGCLMGWIAAQWLVGSVATTVNALYVKSTQDAAQWHWGEASLAMMLGVLASMLAGWIPSRHVATTPAAETFKKSRYEGSSQALNRPLTGVFCALIGWLLSRSPAWSMGGQSIPMGGYAAALLWVLAITLVLPAAFRFLGQSLSAWSPSPGLLFASSQARRPSSRHLLSIAALAVAIGMAGGMALMIKSFEKTMVQWISHSLRADLYIACKGVGNASSQNRMARTTWSALVSHPAVSLAEVGQMFPIQWKGKPTFLTGMPQEDPLQWTYPMWLEKPSELKSSSERNATFPQAAISESFQSRFDVHLGDRVEIPTPSGSHTVQVVGVFAEYGNERGTLAVGRSHLSQWFEDDRAINVALTLKPGIDPEEVRAELLSNHPGIAVRTQSKLRAEVIHIFQQTFSVTVVLQWLAIGVALVGLILSLNTSLHERRLEFQILKHLGMGRFQMARTIAMESVLCSWVGFVGGLFLAISLGWLLVHVINKQSFGWTLMMVIPGYHYVKLWLSLTLVTWLTTIPMGWWSANQRMHKEE